MNQNFNLPPGCSSLDSDFDSSRRFQRKTDEQIITEQEETPKEDSPQQDFTDVDHDG